MYFLLCEDSRPWVRMGYLFIPPVLFPVELCWYFNSLSRNLISQFQREETQLFVLRVMVGLVILYDHVHPQGAFVKASNVDVSMNTCQIQWYTAFACILYWGEPVCFLVSSFEDYRLNTWDQCPAWFRFFTWNHILDVLCGVSSLLFLLRLVGVKKPVVQADNSSQFNAEVYNAWTLTYTLILQG